MWWSDMANCLYPAFIGGGDPCGQLGLCKVKSVLGDWTCDDCTDIMTRVAEFMKKDETIAQGISILQARFKNFLYSLSKWHFGSLGHPEHLVPSCSHSVPSTSLGARYHHYEGPLRQPSHHHGRCQRWAR